MVWNYTKPNAAAAASAAPAASVHPVPPLGAVVAAPAPAAVAMALPPAPAAPAPAVQPAAPAAVAPQAVTPAAAQPAAPAPTRRRRTPTATAPAAPAAAAPIAPAVPVAAAPAATAQSAAIISTQPNTAAVALPQGSYLSTLIAGAQSAGNALSKWLDRTASHGEPNAFPTAVLNDNGYLDRDKMNPEGSDAELPLGRDGFYGVFLGFRLSVVMWPKKYEKGQTEQPLWQAKIGQDRGDFYELAAEAFKRYSYTKSAARTAFDPYGHPKMAMEILWFDQEAGIIVTRTTSTITSIDETMGRLTAALPKGTGPAGEIVALLQPFPALVKPSEKIPQASKGGENWDEYAIAIQQEATGPGAEAVAAFQSWLANGGYTADLDEALKDWAKTTLTDEQAGALQGVADLRPGR